MARYNKIAPSTCRVRNHTGNIDTYIIKISLSDMPVILCKKYKLHKTLTEWLKRYVLLRVEKMELKIWNLIFQHPTNFIILNNWQVNFTIHNHAKLKLHFVTTAHITYTKHPYSVTDFGSHLMLLAWRAASVNCFNVPHRYTKRIRLLCHREILSSYCGTAN